MTSVADGAHVLFVKIKLEILLCFGENDVSGVCVGEGRENPLEQTCCLSFQQKRSSKIQSSFLQDSVHFVKRPIALRAC